MNLDLTIYLTREGRHYVAHAMPLDVVSSGPTPEAAREAVYEAVRAFLLTAADQGTLEVVLEESGYERRGDRWVCPDFVSLEKHELAVAV
jgi:predicted RNase H-like HicB family nuclease